MAGHRPCARHCSKGRSEEHTSELQSHHDLVCRLLLEKKKKRYAPSRVLRNPRPAREFAKTRAGRHGGRGRRNLACASSTQTYRIPNRRRSEEHTSPPV